MSAVKGFSVGPVKVSTLRQIIAGGQFNNLIAAIRMTQAQIKIEMLAARQYKKTLKIIRELMEEKDGKVEA